MSGLYKKTVGKHPLKLAFDLQLGEDVVLLAHVPEIVHVHSLPGSPLRVRLVLLPRLYDKIINATLQPLKCLPANTKNCWID